LALEDLGRDSHSFVLWDFYDGGFPSVLLFLYLM